MPRRQPPAAAPPPDDELARLAVDLDLTALAAALREILGRAETENPSYTELASEMLRTEWRARKERKLSRSLKRSRLGTVEGVDGFNWAARPQLEARVVKELLNCQFVQDARPIICVGKPGLGKTRIAKAIAHAACLRGHSVLFTTTADMLDDLHGSLADGTYRRVSRRYTKPRLLVCDELGYLPFDRQMANHLFRIVAARHTQGSIIVTANTGFKNWKTFFPSEAQAVATVDRLVDRATILRFTGKTWRNPHDVHGAPLDDE